VPSATVSSTVFVAGVKTVTSPVKMLPTQACLPSGVLATE
jgi:hypothetical protein